MALEVRQAKLKARLKMAPKGTTVSVAALRPFGQRGVKDFAPGRADKRAEIANNVKQNRRCFDQRRHAHSETLISPPINTPHAARYPPLTPRPARCFKHKKRIRLAPER